MQLVPVLTVSPEQRGEITMLMLMTSAENRMMEMRLKLLLLGAGKGEDGKPLTEAEVLRIADAKRKEFAGQYRDILAKLPAGDLREALKEDAIAESRYLGLYGIGMGSIGWKTQLAAAKTEIDRTRSRVEFELDALNK